MNLKRKCLICFTSLDHKILVEGKNSNRKSFESTQLLSDQLNVIFVLENIFELKPAQLQIYLRQRGNPGEWVKFCDKCEQDVRNIRETFLKLHEFKRKFEKAKNELQDRVRVQEEERAMTGRKVGTDSVFYECRYTFLRKRIWKPSACIQNPFKDGDQKAAMLAVIANEGRDNHLKEEDEHEDFGVNLSCPSPCEGDDFSECNISSSHDDDVVSPSDASSIEKEPESLESETLTITKRTIVPSSSKENLELTRNTSTCQSSTSENNRPPLKKTRLFERLDEAISAVIENSKSLPTKTENTMYSPDSPPPPKKFVICPICKVRPPKMSLMSFGEHFHGCLTSAAGANSVLNCSLCENWSCSNGNDSGKAFMKHVVVCKDRVFSKWVPWRHAVVRCDLCEPSKAAYLPYPDYIRHIYNYHQHKYGCSKCPFRSLMSTIISLKHWPYHHKNLLETPHRERFNTLSDGTTMPLPKIPWWCPGSKCYHVFLDEASRDLHLNDCRVFSSEALERSFKCSYCPLSYFSEEELQMHRVSVHGRYKADAPKCEECNLIFNNRKALQVHQRKVHKVNLFKCGTCSAEFHDNDQLHGHMRLVHGNKEELKDYTCDICQKIFSHKFKLRRHLGNAHSLQKCLDCRMEFDDEEALLSHLRREHNRPIGIPIHSSNSGPKSSSSKRSFCCTWESCGKLYKSSAALYLHEKYSHKEKQDYICDLCGKSCNTPTLLNTHIKHVHEKRLSFHCDVCVKGFPDGRSLNSHRAARHGIGFKCDVEGCTKVLPNQKKLEDHKKYKHEGVDEPRPFSCQFCGNGFTEERKVKHHELSVHINKHSRPFKCPLHQCEKTFPTQLHVNYHLKYTHKIDKAENSN